MNKKINLYRIPFQIAILAILLFILVTAFFKIGPVTDIEAFCPFGGLQATLGYFVTNSLACSMTTRQISLGAMLLLGVVLAGKLFCSHICPIGTVSEWVGRFGKIKRIHWVPPYWLDKGLRIIKYALLFTTLYFTITSSELFCKKYDPYFASMNSSSGDILWITASLSLLFAFILPILITNFWCKYICPLGAISNIFKFLPIWLPAIVLITGLNYFGIFTTSWIVVLAIVILLACLAEIIKTRSYTVAGLHIVRDQTTCTDCKKCDRKCPMNIKVSQDTVVRHIDCHLCGECITHCPEKNTLSFNRKKIRWIPSLLIIVLISAGLVISAYTEIPTINQQWGTAEQLQRSENFLQENLSQIKCFGSSSSFSTRMHEINGVVGVSCFAGKHSARIFFDPKITSAKSIKEKIFEPSIRIFSFPNAINQNVGIIQLGINHFFDPGDADLLAIRFEESKGVYAFKTSFGESIMTTIYFDRKLVSVKEIMSLINKREYQLKQNNHASSQNTNFETTAPNKEEVSEAVPIIDLLYRAMDIALNDKESQKKENIKTLTLNFQQSINKDNFNWIPHLMSHLSGDKGVINFKATCQGGKPLLIIVYVDAKTDANTILKTLNLPVLNIFMDNGETVSLKNPFYFKPIDIL